MSKPTGVNDVIDNDEPMTAQRTLYLAAKTIRILYSAALLAFSIAVVMTATDKAIKGAGGIVLFWILVLWLSVLEGGQNALVGLQPVPKEKYARSHKVTTISTTVAHRDGNMERFIVGRQLLVVVVVFTINLCGSIKSGCSDSFSMASWLEEIACEYGIALILITIMIGQLTTQIVCAKYMLEFINNYIMVVTTYLALAIEFSGILHSVYLVQIAFNYLTGADKDEKEGNKEEKSTGQVAFFWVRVLFSLLCLSFSFAVVLSEIGKGRNNLTSIHPAGSIIIFFVLMFIVGIMEGMQIALFAVVRADPNVPRSTFAQMSCDLAFKGSNLRKFVVGRQVLVTVCMFIIARITGIDQDHEDFDNGDTSLGVSKGFQDFINTNLLSALITTIVASLMFRVIASSFPMKFLSIPIIPLIIRLCLLIEFTGIMEFAWVMAKVYRRVFRYKSDEYYINKEQRAAVVTTL